MQDDASGPTARNNTFNAQCGWVMEAWTNGYGKLRRCTERDGTAVDFYLSLAAAFVTARPLIREARQRFRWDGRPSARRLK